MSAKSISNSIHQTRGVSKAMAVALAGVFVVAVGGALWASKLLVMGATDAELEARRARIAGMTDAEKEQLRIKQERFNDLEAGEQARLRALHTAIQNHPRHDELQRVMMRYRQWLRELTPEDRAGLLTTDVSERLALVQTLQEKLHQRYLAEAGKEMSKEDAQAVRNWMDEFASSRVPKALEVANDWEKRGLEKAIEREDHGFQRQIVWQFIFRGKIPPPGEEDHRRLAAAMSQERRQTFERAKTEDERARVVNAWIMGTMSFRRGWGGPSHEDLQKELEKLPPDERQRISTLPPEMMREALKRKWWENRANRERGRGGRGPGERGPGGRGPGDRVPGDRGPGDRGPDDFPPGPPNGPPPGPPGRGDRDDDRKEGGRDDRRDEIRRRDGDRHDRRGDDDRDRKRDEKPADETGNQSGNQSGDQSGDRPTDGNTAAVRRALIRT